MERGNLRVDENQKGTNRRKIRPKVEKLHVGAEVPVVVTKPL